MNAKVALIACAVATLAACNANKTNGTPTTDTSTSYGTAAGTSSNGTTSTDMSKSVDSTTTTKGSSTSDINSASKTNSAATDSGATTAATGTSDNNTSGVNAPTHERGTAPGVTGSGNELGDTVNGTAPVAAGERGNDPALGSKKSSDTASTQTTHKKMHKMHRKTHRNDDSALIHRRTDKRVAAVAPVSESSRTTTSDEPLIGRGLNNNEADRNDTVATADTAPVIADRTNDRSSDRSVVGLPVQAHPDRSATYSTSASSSGLEVMPARTYRDDDSSLSGSSSSGQELDRMNGRDDRVGAPYPMRDMDDKTWRNFKNRADLELLHEGA